MATSSATRNTRCRQPANNDNDNNNDTNIDTNIDTDTDIARCRRAGLAGWVGWMCA